MKTIKISDGMAHMNETVTMDDTGVHGSDWVIGILQRNGCKIGDHMTDDEIASEVYDAWTSAGYDGDPVANGLTVTVS